MMVPKNAVFQRSCKIFSYEKMKYRLLHGASHIKVGKAFFPYDS